MKRTLINDSLRTATRNGFGRLMSAYQAVCHSRLMRDESGQDLIEYALMAATIAVATAAIFPQSIAPNICAIFSKVNSTLVSANN